MRARGLWWAAGESAGPGERADAGNPRNFSKIANASRIWAYRAVPSAPDARIISQDRPFSRATIASTTNSPLIARVESRNQTVLTSSDRANEARRCTKQTPDAKFFDAAPPDGRHGSLVEKRTRANDATRDRTRQLPARDRRPQVMAPNSETTPLNGDGQPVKSRRVATAVGLGIVLCGLVGAVWSGASPGASSGMSMPTKDGLPLITGGDTCQTYHSYNCGGPWDDDKPSTVIGNSPPLPIQKPSWLPCCSPYKCVSLPSYPDNMGGGGECPCPEGETCFPCIPECGYRF